MSQRVVLEEYSERWAALYAQEHERVRRALAPAQFAFYHIGSTAVPGLLAKPVIDMLLVAPSTEVLDEASPLLETLGYEPRGEYGIVGRRYFVRCKAGSMRMHLHAFAQGAPQVAAHLAFRDRLIASEEARKAYADAKRAAARGGAARKDEYQRDKADCIARILSECDVSRSGRTSLSACSAIR